MSRSKASEDDKSIDLIKDADFILDKLAVLFYKMLAMLANLHCNEDFEKCHNIYNSQERIY